MQYDTKLDMKVCSDQILARTRWSHIGGYGVGYKRKTIFRNAANITRESVGNFSKFIRNFKLAIPSIIDWDCIKP